MVDTISRWNICLRIVQAGKGIVILTTTVDKLVDSSGKIVSTALLGAGDLSVWALDTFSGTTNKLVSGKTPQEN